MPEDTSNNALGLDFAEKADKSDSQTSQEPFPDLKTVKKEKEKPYVNLERVKTGGAQRVRSLFSIYLVLLTYHLGQAE